MYYRFTGWGLQMDEQTKNELEVIGGGMIWFAFLLADISSLVIVWGTLYLGFLGNKIYR
jgi:hypothetical protein